MNHRTTDPGVAANPYGAATCITTLERQRIHAQFVLHTAPLLQRATALLGGRHGLRLLDVGSGYGAVVSTLDPIGQAPAELRLLDNSADLLAIAHQRAQDAGVRVRAHLGAIDKAPLPADLQGNDLVLCSFTATHLTDLAAGMAQMARALRPQGLLVLVDADYCASFAMGCEHASQTLRHVQAKLHVTKLSATLPWLALAHGLRPVEALPCTDVWQTYTGIDGTRDTGLGFVGHFHEGDPALASWRRIGRSSVLMLRRIAHVYQRA